MALLGGRTAFVTGSTSGIGYAIAGALLDAGATVIIHGRDAARVERAATSLNGGQRVSGLVGDLSTEEGCHEILAVARSLTRHVDILVNNAGAIARSSLLRGDTADYGRLMQINAVSGLILARELLPAMLDADDGGRIIWISSETAVMPPPDMGPYAVSKAAQIIMSRLIAQEAAGTSVTSNAVIAGPTRTEGADALVGDALDAWDDVMAKYPASLLRGPAEPRDIALVVAWLASPASSVVRGSVIRADGGVVPTL